jgi:citrate synthase
MAACLIWKVPRFNAQSAAEFREIPALDNNNSEAPAIVKFTLLDRVCKLRVQATAPVCCAGDDTMNNGLEGVVAADTVLSYVNGNDGTLWVRGHNLEDLVKNHGFEGTVAIVWEGFSGEGLTRAKIQSEFGLARERAFAHISNWIDSASGRPILEGVRIALAALSESSEPSEIVAALPIAIAALVRVRDGKRPVKPDPVLTTAADFLRMLKDQPATAAEIGALDTYFTTVCENGLGSSSFVARVMSLPPSPSPRPGR